MIVCNLNSCHDHIYSTILSLDAISVPSFKTSPEISQNLHLSGTVVPCRPPLPTILPTPIQTNRNHYSCLFQQFFQNLPENSHLPTAFVPTSIPSSSPILFTPQPFLFCCNTSFKLTRDTLLYLPNLLQKRIDPSPFKPLPFCCINLFKHHQRLARGYIYLVLLSLPPSPLPPPSSVTCLPSPSRAGHLSKSVQCLWPFGIPTS